METNSMGHKRSDEIEGEMELTHESDPFYMKIFYITITIGVLYLGVILLKTL